MPEFAKIDDFGEIDGVTPKDIPKEQQDFRFDMTGFDSPHVFRPLYDDLTFGDVQNLGSNSSLPTGTYVYVKYDRFDLAKHVFALIFTTRKRTRRFFYNVGVTIAYPEHNVYGFDIKDAYHPPKTPAIFVKSKRIGGIWIKQGQQIVKPSGVYVKQGGAIKKI